MLGGLQHFSSSEDVYNVGIARGISDHDGTASTTGISSSSSSSTEQPPISLLILWAIFVCLLLSHWSRGMTS